MRLNIDISAKFTDALYQDKNESRDRLLSSMGVKDKNPPMLIDNAIERVINPWYVAKKHSQEGFPKDMTLEEIGKNLKIDWKDYWSEWCEFWFESFIKIPHTILLDSRKYFKAIGY